MPSYHAEADLPLVSPQTAYEVAADIESYPEFVPGFIRVRIIERRGNKLLVEQTLAAGPLQQRFISTAQLKPFEYIRVKSKDSIFSKLVIEWRFTPLGNGCRARFTIDYRLDDRFPFPIALLETLLPDADSVLNAFTARAQKRAVDKLSSTGHQTDGK